MISLWWLVNDGPTDRLHHTWILGSIVQRTCFYARSGRERMLGDQQWEQIPIHAQYEAACCGIVSRLVTQWHWAGHQWAGKGIPFCIDAPYIWALPVWVGGSKRLPRWFGALTVFGSIQTCRMVKNGPKKVPQSARLSAGGSNRYLGNAQMEGASTHKGLP